MRSDLERLKDIKEAVTQIEKYSLQGKDTFQREELIQIWIIHHLQIIGEASNSLSTNFIKQHPEIPWQKIIAFRNVIVHEYFRVDLDTIWKIVKQDLKELQSQVELILETLKSDS